MKEAELRRRAMNADYKKEAWLVFNGSTDTLLPNTRHNSRMSYEYKVRYNSFGSYMLVCSFFRSLNATSASTIQCVYDPNVNVSVNLELNTPYVLAMRCKTNGAWSATLDDDIIASGNIGSYSRGTGIKVGYYDDSGSFAKLRAEVAYIKIWDERGLLVNDLVPKEFDGVCGFYDKVDGAFYGARRGSFTIKYY